jgi:hypothetical protein
MFEDEVLADDARSRVQGPVEPMYREHRGASATMVRDSGRC